MKEKIKQKGFIQIPLLIGIIVAVIIISAVGTGVVLHRQASTDKQELIIEEIIPELQEEPGTTPEETEELTESEVKNEKEIIEERELEETETETDIIIFEPPEEEKSGKEEQKIITYSGSEYGGKIHDYFPIITAFFTNPSPTIPINIGSEIHLRVEVHEPQNRQVLYQWWCLNCGLDINYEWVTENEIKYKTTPEDVKKSGESMRIGVRIKSEKEYYRTGGHGYDDGIYTDYRFAF